MLILFAFIKNNIQNESESEVAQSCLTLLQPRGL